MANLIETITSKVKSLFEETENTEEKKEAMAEAVVKDTGITITADAFEVGNTVTTVTEEGDAIAIPEGSYELEDGTIITVDAEGVITEVVAAEVEEVEVEDKKEEEMAKEEKVEEPAYVTEEQLAAAMKPILSALESVSVKMSALTPKEDTQTPEKIEAENKLLKQRLSEKRKAIQDKAEKPLPKVQQLQSKTKRGHVSSTRENIKSRFADFDFSIKN